MKIEIEEFGQGFATIGEQIKDFNLQLTKLGFPSIKFFREDDPFEPLSGRFNVQLNVAPWVARLDFKTQEVLSVSHSRSFDF